MKPKQLVITGILVAWILILLISTKQKTNTNKIQQQDETKISETVGSGTTSGAGNFFEISKDKKSKSVADLELLEKIYNKTQSLDVLKQIVEKQAQNYQFNEALNNCQILKSKGSTIDNKLYLYIVINSNAIKLSDKNSIDNFIKIVQEAKNNDEIDNQDQTFYLGLKEIWNLNYNQALIDWESINKDEYRPIINAFKEVIKSHQDEKSLPEEYRDGLVALTALKNGYFNIARKVALEALNKNEKYILPYQILAYSHFLSNNRDVSIEYFLRLAEFDQPNKDMYNFLIGAAYYRKADYSSSSIYLSQVSKTNKTDTLRYLIQNYIHLNTPEKAKESRKMLMSQNDVSPSDFSLYFYSIFYKSYFTMNMQEVERYKDISSIILQNCKDRFPESDVCVYGDFGKATLENTIQNDEAKYLNLTKQYNLSYLYHIWGDYFSKQNEGKKAQEAYARAVGLSSDASEQMILKQKIEALKL